MDSKPLVAVHQAGHLRLLSEVVELVGFLAADAAKDVLPHGFAGGGFPCGLGLTGPWKLRPTAGG